MMQGGGDKGEHALSIMDILERRARALTVNAILKDENAIKVQTDRQTESDGLI
jgi:hypothetical protein